MSKLCGHLDKVELPIKHIGKTRTVMNTLVVDNHFKLLKSSDLARMLWLIEDGLESINKSANELINHIQTNKTQ